MKTGIVKFSKEFKTPIATTEWIGLELQYDMASECPKEVLTNAKTIVEQWYKESSAGYPNLLNPDEHNFIPPGPPPIINVQRTSEDIRIAELVRDIYACTQLDGDNGLWSYGKLAATSEEARLAYEVMGKKLRAKENQELLDATKEFYEAQPKFKKK